MIETILRALVLAGILYAMHRLDLRGRRIAERAKDAGRARLQKERET